jgi:hypothetical protein
VGVGKDQFSGIGSYGEGVHQPRVVVWVVGAQFVLYQQVDGYVAEHNATGDKRALPAFYAWRHRDPRWCQRADDGTQNRE